MNLKEDSPNQVNPDEEIPSQYDGSARSGMWLVAILVEIILIVLARIGAAASLARNWCFRIAR